MQALHAPRSARLELNRKHARIQLGQVVNFPCPPPLSVPVEKPFRITGTGTQPSQLLRGELLENPRSLILGREGLREARLPLKVQLNERPPMVLRQVPHKPSLTDLTSPTQNKGRRCALTNHEQRVVFEHLRFDQRVDF